VWDESQRGETQAFGGRGAGARALVTPTGVLGAPGAPSVLAEIGGLGEVRAWNVWASPVIVPIVGQLPPLRQLAAGAGGGSALAAGVATALVAIVEWTVDGARFNAEIDITQGARLTVVADRVKLAVANETGINDGGAALGAMEVVGGIAPASAASPSPALRTRYFGATPEDDETGALLPVTITVPPWARTVVPLVTPIGTLGGYTLNFLDSAGAVIGTREYPERVYGVGPGSQIEGEALPLLLPNDCRGIQLVTGASQARTAHRFIFELYL